MAIPRGGLALRAWRDTVNSLAVMAPSDTTSAAKILMLVGSARRESYTRALASDIRRGLETRSARGEVLDLFETPLPQVDLALRAERDRHPDPTAAGLFRAAEAAEAFVLATPVYHNSYSGVLKNALDHLMLRDMRYRPVGLAAHSGRSTQAVDHLRQVVRGLLGVSIPTQISTRDADFTAASPGVYRVADSEILARIERFCDELVLFAAHMRALRADLDRPKAAD